LEAELLVALISSIGLIMPSGCHNQWELVRAFFGGLSRRLVYIISSDDIDVASGQALSLKSWCIESVQGIFCDDIE